MTVRPAQPDDDLDALNEGNPDWVLLRQALQRYAELGTPGLLVLVGELDGRPVGVGCTVALGFVAGGTAPGEVWVLPAGRGHGVGRALFERILVPVRDAGLPGMTLTVEGHDERSLGIAQAHGLELTGTHVESVLHVDRVDDGVLDAALRAVSGRGVTIAPLPDDADETVWREVHAWWTAVRRDAPDTADDAEAVPFAMFASSVQEPWQLVVARDADGGIVAASWVTRRADDVVNTLFTGVVRDWRGRGLSSAVKAEAIRQVREHGFRRILTQNMSVNTAILAANRRLGFEPVRTYHDVTFTL